MGLKITRILVCSLLAALLSASGFDAYSQNTKAQEQRRAKLQKELQILDGQIKANASKSSNALSRLTIISKKVSSRKDLVNQTDSVIASYSKEINKKNRDIAAIQSRLDTLTFYYSKLIRSSYKNRNAKIWYMYILASDDVSQAFRRYGYLRDLSKQMNVQAVKIKATQEELKVEKAKLDSIKVETQKIRNLQVSELNKLKSEEDESKTIVNQLSRDKKKYLQELATKKREIEALNREIERIIRSAIEEKSGGAKKSTTTTPRKPIDYTLAKQFESNKGKLPWPAEGPVVDRFGQHYHPVYTKVLLPFNNGVSIALPEGTAVKAVFDGVVKQIAVMPGYNKCVLIQHGNYFSFYCKLGSVNVKAGDKIKTGQIVGTVDTINGETILHFQIWSGKNPQNPETWLRP